MIIGIIIGAALATFGFIWWMPEDEIGKALREANAWESNQVKMKKALEKKI
jgi:hypothetical protein